MVAVTTAPIWCCCIKTAITRCIPQAGLLTHLPAPDPSGAFEGLSRMKGNFHVRFLGGGVRVIEPRYPTCDVGCHVEGKLA